MAVNRIPNGQAVRVRKAVKVASVKDSETMLQDLTVGSTISVVIVASSEGSESVPSETAVFLVV